MLEKELAKKEEMVGKLNQQTKDLKREMKEMQTKHDNLMSFHSVLPSSNNNKFNSSQPEFLHLIAANDSLIEPE
jgi:phage shock protein A